MKISFNDVSKRFAYEWIFRNVNYEIESQTSHGIIGPNGSGKSTLVRLLLGTMEASQGDIKYISKDKTIKPEDVFNRFSFAAPYMDLPANFTIEELIKFHFSFRECIDGISIEDIAVLSMLTKSKHKTIRQFSSGMKQRLKLILAICTESEVLVFDEPTTNLDDDGKQWFHETLKKYRMNRTLIIATNEKDDLRLVDQSMNILDYK